MTLIAENLIAAQPIGEQLAGSPELSYTQNELPYRDPTPEETTGFNEAQASFEGAVYADTLGVKTEFIIKMRERGVDTTEMAESACLLHESVWLMQSLDNENQEAYDAELADFKALLGGQESLPGLNTWFIVYKAKAEIARLTSRAAQSEQVGQNTVAQAIGSVAIPKYVGSHRRHWLKDKMHAFNDAPVAEEAGPVHPLVHTIDPVVLLPRGPGEHRAGGFIARRRAAAGKHRPTTIVESLKNGWDSIRVLPTMAVPYVTEKISAAAERRAIKNPSTEKGMSDKQKFALGAIALGALAYFAAEHTGINLRMPHAAEIHSHIPPKSHAAESSTAWSAMSGSQAPANPTPFLHKPEILSRQRLPNTTNAPQIPSVPVAPIEKYEIPGDSIWRHAARRLGNHASVEQINDYMNKILASNHMTAAKAALQKIGYAFRMVKP